ncbi:hypothetical protein [Kitasatospora sp. NPDC050543]|uniref:hypothetical protein n=1 Tax=Kitasatospora sp. NPDC050543 TaxID=3364054 RepID=UPI00378A4C28
MGWGQRLDGWVRVPVGDGALRWATRGRCRRVLLIVHNVTAATRLLDVIPLFRDDLRVQLLATCTGSSPFQAGVAELLAAVGVPVLPWEQAVGTPVDLAVSASLGGELDAVQGKLAVLSHGVGYNKRLATPDTGHRTPDTGHPAPVFGLAPQWLLSDGVPVADAMVLSHPEQFERLSEACPEAVPTAVLGGDPCFDRILAAARHRERYRRALGVRHGQRLVLLNSTWNPSSLFGDGGPEDVLPLLLPRLTAELPADEYRVAAVLHPNIWHGHGPGQIRLWLDRARRAGLALVDPLEGWRQALIAADLVLGDFGSVSYYAAACGTPVLLGAPSTDGLGPSTPVAAFVREAPVLDPYAELLPQLEKVLNHHQPMSGPRELTSSVPGRAARLLRGIFYGLIGIPEPAGPAVLDPLPLPPYDPPLRTAPLRVLTAVTAGGEVEVRRFGDPSYEPDGPGGGGHLAVHEDTLDPGMPALADVIYRYGDADDPRLGRPQEWAAEVLARYPSCALAAYVTARDSCTVLHRSGLLVRLTSADAPEAAGAADPAALASALFAWLSSGGLGEPGERTEPGRPGPPGAHRDPAQLYASGLIVRTGPAVHRVRVTPLR